MSYRLLTLLAVLLAASGQAPADLSLCEGSAFVTGTRAETRGPALGRALKDVLVKRSGDPALAHDPRVEPLEANVAALVADYLYLDRMSDQPKHDEQGTRDRPYKLIARFDCGKVDAALNALGDQPWLTPRPTLVPRVLIIDKQRARFP